MDLSGPQSLGNILQPEELKLVPEDIQKKLSAYIEQFSDEYCKERAAAHRLEEAEQKSQELTSKMDDYLIKFQNFEQNVLELRTQLDQMVADRAQLQETVNNSEQILSSLRNEKTTAIEERDSLMRVIERQQAEMDHLKQDLQNYQQQLNTAIVAKCQAITRVDEINSKEIALESKERRYESERAMQLQEIQLLSSNLNRSNAELQNIRREHTLTTMQLEASLKEKTDALQLLQNQSLENVKIIEDLKEKMGQISQTMYQHNQTAEVHVQNLVTEIDAKEKLIELMRSSENCIKGERDELLVGIAELKGVFDSVQADYVKLEAQNAALQREHAIEEDKLNKKIEDLRREIAGANELLKESQDRSLESAICQLAPSAAVASRLMRSELSLTELYSMYAKTSEELEACSRDNAQLKLQIKSILEEVSESAPLIQKQGNDHQKLLETHALLTEQRNELAERNLSLEHELERTSFNLSHCQKEAKKLKQTHSDLSRQVCVLLDELNCLRCGVQRSHNRPERDDRMDVTTESVISRELVTFASIQDLQENNVKLLAITRELAALVEENEKDNDKLKLQQCEENLKKVNERFTGLEEVLAQKNNSITTLLEKCERYKKFYFSAQKKMGKKAVDLDDSSIQDLDESLALETSTKSAAQLQGEKVLEQRVRSLEQQLEDETKKYASLKENYDYYTSEKRKNDALAQEQFDSMRKEVRELTSANCKLMNATEFQKEQIDLLHKSIATYKQQVTALEERTKSYEKTIIKHEQTVLMLKDEVMAAHRKHAAADSDAHNLRQENRILKDSLSRLQIEKEAYYREHQSQSLLLNNLEFIKANLERSEMEGRQRLEQRLDDSVRELAAQRRHFQEKEEKFRETINDFKRQTETAVKLKEEEKQLAEKWHADLLAVRDELAKKESQVSELSKKLQESLTPSINENPIATANKRAREFELKFEQASVEIESLTKELAKAREHGEQFFRMSQSAESEIKRLHEMHTELVANQEAEIKSLRISEAELKTRLTVLEAESMLSNFTEQSKATNQSDQLKIAQDELKKTLEKLRESGNTVSTLRAENSVLAQSLNAVEMKYANEMVLHSADIQDLARFKADFLKVQDELNKLKSGSESLQAAHDELLRSNAEAQALLKAEKEQSERRVADLHSLNASLHDQIEALTSKMTALASRNAEPNSSFMLNESASVDPDQSLNASGEEAKNSQQLLLIIKFLRKEKDLFAAKLDILKAENARLSTEHTIQQKKMDELNGFLNQERAKSQTDVVSATKHEEVLRKIETLNAITDSNRILRDERNALVVRVTELTDRISSLEQELFPLQSSNKELSSKIEELNVETNSLRTEAIKWRQRANALVEKSNRNPEEFKRLQSEREHLAKMLTAEKELSKKQQEELSSLKQRLETEIPSLNKNLQLLDEARKKQAEESTSLKQNNSRQAQDIMDLKNRLLQKEEELLKANEELETKDKTIADKDTKELQLRKLAKRYKDFYMGLQAQAGGSETVAEQEKIRSDLDEVNNQLRALKEEYEKVTKENEELKKRTEPDTDSSNAVRQEYKAKLDKLVVDLTVARTDLVNQETTFAGTKSSYDETIARLEKELQENIASNKEISQRLTRENESLHMRINQLTRQLGSQQSTKPSTSSVAEKGNISESSPRTANVKPMSGSATVQQSATVQPWRGGETPLASIRPISVQNSRTAAILPTSQQPSAGSSTSTSSSSSSSSSSSTSTTSAAASGGSSAAAQTALVPPQQQVHTTGSAALESMASSSPTSSHTDYMPSTSSAAVAVAAIPPMGASSAAESSQEAESIQHPQQNDAQLFVGGAQQQVVALVSPRVEGSSSSSSSTSAPNATAPSVQDGGNQSQQPSTSGSSSSSSTVVSSHSRHTPSSSNVTTTQAGCSSVGIKRPRDVEGDSSTTNEEGGPEKMPKMTKRLRVPMHSGELSAGHIGDSGIDVDQMPTSSQRDQEDDIQVVDSDDEEDVLADADDGPIDGGEAEQEVYEDSYEQDNEMDENEGADDDNEMAADAQDNNEVDIEEVPEQQQAQEESHQLLDSQAVAAVPTSAASGSGSDNQNNQSQAISSGSGESSNPVTLPQAEASNWKLAVASTSSAAARRNESSMEIVSSPQVSNFSEQPARLDSAEVDGTAVAMEVAPDESAGPSSDNSAAAASSPQKQGEAGESSGNDAASKASGLESDQAGGAEDASEADEAFAEETMASGQGEDSQPLGSDNPNVGTSQSEVSDNQANQAEGNATEDSEGADGVSSEGEKQAVGVEEEGREAEATSPSENTRFRTLRSAVPTRRGNRTMMRGNTSNNPNRPQRIVWQRETSPGNVQRDQPPSTNRVFSPRARSRRPIRRPSPNNFNNNGGRFP